MSTWREELEDYLDNQPWWRKVYWPAWRFWNTYNPRQLYREVTYFIQRGRRGYSDRDLWNVDCHIARTVLGFLDAGGKWGVPVTSIDKDEPFEKSQARWKKIEADLRWLMEQHLADDPDTWGDPAHRKRVERANRLFGKYWMSFWD